MFTRSILEEFKDMSVSGHLLEICQMYKYAKRQNWSKGETVSFDPLSKSFSIVSSLSVAFIRKITSAQAATWTFWVFVDHIIQIVAFMEDISQTPKLN